jgi:hypothetical protein
VFAGRGCGTAVCAGCPGQVQAGHGGSAWDAVRSTYARAKITTSGLTGEAQSRQDNLTGKYLEEYKLGPSSGADGFDGKQVWSKDSSGQPRSEGAENARQGAADEAYRTAMGYWYPQRWDAQMECLGEKEEQGKKFAVLRITPSGGRPFDMWIDAQSYLVDHTVEKQDIETRSNYFSDYRTVQGVKVPFTTLSTNGDHAYDQRIQIVSIEFNQPLQEAVFRMPAPPPPDFTIAGNKTATSVPFELLNNHIYLQVKLNGQGPFRLLCDTGGANIVSPELAKELGLKSEGALQGRGVGEKSEDVGLVKMQSVQVGEATLSNQVFAVFPMETFSNVEGVAVKGLIGYEMFKRFTSKVDYEHDVLTFTIPSAFKYSGTGTAVPFIFNAHIPQVDGSIDGMAGKFELDTGSRSSIDLLGPFVQQHDLVKRYNATLQAVTGWGVGGASRSLVTRGKLLTLGKVEVPNPITELTLQKKGAFSSGYVAGNVGAGVLKRFNVTFDYQHQQIIFEPNANFNKPDVFDRSGMWLNLAGASFEVMDVVAGGPAAQAGLKVGDKILAVDGQPASQISLPALRARFKSDAPGSQAHLTVQSGSEKREINLVLRDLV